MTKINAANNARTTLAGSINDTVDNFNVVDGSSFPASNFIVNINNELMLVETRTGNTFSGITRGIEGTFPASHSAGDYVENRFTAGTIGQLWDEHDAHGADYAAHGDIANSYRTNKDSESIFTTIEWKRPNGTLFKISVLSGGTSPQYTTRTVTYYESDGITVKQTVVYNQFYDVDGDWTHEVMQ